MRCQQALSKRDGDKLHLLIQRPLDNNESGFFYLHADADCQIYENCCALLALSVPLAVEHYEACLHAKTAQLKEPFQAKLGYLIADLFGRVGTVEWDSAQTESTVRTTASDILRSTFIVIDDNYIKEGIAELEANG